jgi:P-type E1-E2 ATPase
VGPNRLDNIFALQSEIERRMTILGATAIEDKLQCQVKETITDLKKSGVKVWMLTGDKKETATSIGYSCGLIDENSEKITLDCEPENI